MCTRNMPIAHTHTHTHTHTTHTLAHLLSSPSVLMYTPETHTRTTLQTRATGSSTSKKPAEAPRKGGLEFQEPKMSKKSRTTTIMTAIFLPRKRIGCARTCLPTAIASAPASADHCIAKRTPAQNATTRRQAVKITAKTAVRPPFSYRMMYRALVSCWSRARNLFLCGVKTLKGLQLC